ncbi:hypothetical protein EVAR_31822_1 [Eumeta japonica]|uniref:Uncharacterized protein n=1 Tax=Eumeta variegata TaxID=151549 RepID=A0A4C1WI66_EUMVA|nr:hypothetical protein EVAR_31822_1 [Eumeta japonica]
MARLVSSAAQGLRYQKDSDPANDGFTRQQHTGVDPVTMSRSTARTTDQIRGLGTQASTHVHGTDCAAPSNNRSQKKELLGNKVYDAVYKPY